MKPLRFNLWMMAMVAAMAALATACTDNSCPDNGSALPLMRFYTSGTTTQRTITNLTIKGIDAPGDSLLINKQSVNEVFLPLRANANNTQWVLDYNSDALTPDTISISYEPLPYFANVECGAMYIFYISSVAATHHVIDSVAVEKQRIDNVADVALRLFFPNEN